MKSSDKSIVILKLINQAGPISIKQICEMLGLSRSAAYRIVQSLESHDMIQRSLNGSGYIATFSALNMAKNAAVGIPKINEIRSFLKSAPCLLSLYVDIYTWADEGKCLLIESTEKGQPLRQRVPLIGSIAGATLLSMLSPVEQVQRISQALIFANDSERKFVTSGLIAKAIRADPIWGCIKQISNGTIGVPFRIEEQLQCALIVRAKRNTLPNFQIFEKYLHEIWIAQLEYRCFNFPNFSGDAILKRTGKQP